MRCVKQRRLIVSDIAGLATQTADCIIRAPQMPLGPGSRLDAYELVRPLGAGGMGEVWLARDPRLNREVAIKVLPSDRLTDESRRRRFIQEAQAASSLNHPNIITIYEIDSADGRDFIVMELVRGKSLDQLIPRQGMRLNEALRIAIAVADALAAAHARGIVHRDLKPANVMVGLDGTVKVVDFGLAKLLADDDELEEQAVTQLSAPAISVPGMIAGTAAYMSPEQARGERLDARSDVFSFGAMLYEMATGVRAFGGPSAADTLTAVVGGQPARPSDVNDGIPSDLEKVILRCLRKHAERRFQHIADVKVALQEIAGRIGIGPAVPGAVREGAPCVTRADRDHDRWGDRHVGDCCCRDPLVPTTGGYQELSAIAGAPGAVDGAPRPDNIAGVLARRSASRFLVERRA